MVRPSRLVPFSLLMACSASSGVAISTNPKPRERPVSRSVTTLADSTAPDMVEYTLFPGRRVESSPEVRVAALFIEHLRYAGLYLMLFGAGLGLPVPEEVPVVLAGLLSRAQIFRWWLALPVCVVGVLSGDVVLYWLGHHWGERVLDWRPVRCVLPREREAWFLAAYRQHGVKIIFGARHVMGF